MNNNIKKTAKRFIKKYKLTSVDYVALKNTVKDMGYTVIEFNSMCNEKDIEIVIKNLNLEEYIKRSRAFTYVSSEYRLIFVNEDLNAEEKLIVLSHEIGHIVCQHFSRSPVIGYDVVDEYEANEFSHHLLKRSFWNGLRLAISGHKKMVAIIASALFVILAVGVAVIIINKEKSYYGDFYITTTGDRYHQSECIHVKNSNNIERLTKEQFESGEYEPCGICLPQG